MYIEVEVELDEFYRQLDHEERLELAEMLSEDNLAIETPLCRNGNDVDWYKSLKVLAHNRDSLSLEEENIISKIASRFI